jgi:glutathione S-transferase
METPMKLFFAKPSPFARKVRVLIRERNLQNDIQEIETAPFDSTNDLLAVNPASKVPALQLDDGTVLIESNLIAMHLDGLGSTQPLLPDASAVRMLQCWGRAEALNMAAWMTVIEGRRDIPLRSAAWVTRQQLAMERTLAVLEKDAADLTEAPHYANIALGVALGFIDFRLSGTQWRTAHPRLAAWYAQFSQRPSMLATAPN